MRRPLSNVALIAACLLSGSFMNDAPAADSELQSGISAYNAGHYREALPHFYNATQREPRSANAFVYQANCYFALGQFQSADQICTYVTSNFSGTPAAVSAQILSSRIAARLGKRSSTPVNGSPAEPAKGMHHALTLDLNTFIYTVRGAVDVGDVSSSFMNEVKVHLKAMPVKLLGDLQSRGGRICVTPRLADKLPDFRNTRPRGWEEGSAGKNVDGLFDGRDVLVCEYSSSMEDEKFLEKSHRSGYIVRHETGHACDHYWDNLSSTEEFKHTYLLELAKVAPEHREGGLAYFCQKSDAGCSECFAELFATMMGGASSKDVDEQLPRYFPACTKLIKKYLGI